MTEKFAQKRIAITGAGSGLGRAIALRYATDGWRVAVTDRDSESAKAVAAEVVEAGGQALAMTVDVTSEADFEALASKLSSEWQGVDVFVNNAGVASGGSLLDADMAQWRTQIDINLFGVLKGCRAAVPLMQTGGGGHIVNIASFAGLACPPGMVSYNTAKAAVIALSESLRGEVYDHGIGVTVACPAFFPTNLLERFDSPNQAQKLAAQKMMEKSGVTASDVAAGIHRAVADGQFLVIAHELSRQQYEAKRADPEGFFHAVRESMKKFAGGV